MTESDHTAGLVAAEVDPRLAELAERLSGRWRVTGPGIAGDAEYRSVRDGLLLVGRVSVVVNGAELTNIQHISHDRTTDTLRARYLDTLGNEATYSWLLDGQVIRVSQGDVGSDTYFEARFADDNSEYAGTWHYPDDAGDDAAEERIVYTRTP
ncbi:hypothetical protein [Microlunatus speluncae]|uniref:hypothetical protein n=1 Tax=Microlunatus speluncae TaxID=2594267 RepID=UPI0012661088|nr:hypothetical protein [Microlunatus speluncae]